MKAKHNYSMSEATLDIELKDNSDIHFCTNEDGVFMHLTHNRSGSVTAMADITFEELSDLIDELTDYRDNVLRDED